MLFMVSTDPLFSKPEDIKDAISEFLPWLNNLKAKKKVIWFYPKVGKGSVVLFDVTSNKEMNDLMGEWLKIVPVPITYDIIPLIMLDEL